MKEVAASQPPPGPRLYPVIVRRSETPPQKEKGKVTVT